MDSLFENVLPHAGMKVRYESDGVIEKCRICRSISVKSLKELIKKENSKVCYSEPTNGYIHKIFVHIEVNNSIVTYKFYTEHFKGISKIEYSDLLNELYEKAGDPIKYLSAYGIHCHAPFTT